jgi:hypothetical protein
MPRKPKNPLQSTLTRAQRKAYQAAIDEAGDEVGRLRGDPGVLEKDARQAALAAADLNAKALAKTPAEEKIMKFVKRGMHRS